MMRLMAMPGETYRFDVSVGHSRLQGVKISNCAGDVMYLNEGWS